MTFDHRKKEKKNDNYGIFIAPSSFSYAKRENLNLGGNFMNDLQHNCKNIKEVIAYQSNHRKKQNHCTFDGSAIRLSVKEVRTNQELFLNYNLHAHS